MKVINIGNTQLAVRLEHAKRSLNYFIKEFPIDAAAKLQPWFMEDFMAKIAKDDKGDNE